VYEDLKGKIALVTGSGKKTGIGYAIARKLAENGVHVIIGDLGAPPRDQSGVPTGSWTEMEAIAASLAAEFGVRTMALGMDVTDRVLVKASAEKVREAFGRLDLLFNNAGASFGVPADVANYDEGAWLKTIDVNMHSVFRVSQVFLPLMPAGSVIVNTASRAGKVPPLFNGAYAVAKAGVIMLTKVMAKELAGRGIRVNAICPGQIMTDLESWRFGLEAQFLGGTPADREAEMCKTIPLNRIGRPAEAAALAVYLASAEASYLTGQAVNVTGGQLMEL
jgi:NAD(P)-dependent dehydrogenase (short-subunit alcohol dehydrogenase family)